MAENVPLSVVSSLHLQGNYSADIAVGKTKYNTTQHGYWFVVLDRYTLKVVDNINQTSRNTVPNIGTHNTPDHILIVATAGVGLNNTPQGDLFNFIDKNGGGRELRKVEQIGTQFNCGSYAAFGYTLVGILGNQNKPGFELSQLNAPPYGPFLALTLVPTTIGTKTIYTPQALSNS
jgi:hypothetical protein